MPNCSRSATRSFEQVADALGARLQKGHRVRRLDVLREKEDADTGVGHADLLRRAEPLVGVGRRHPDVHDGDVGLVHRDVAKQIVGGAGLRDDVEPGLLEQPRHALPEEHRVVGEDDPARIAELRDGAAQRWEVPGQAVGEHLVDRLRVGKSLEAVRAEVARLDFRDERRRRRREEHLAAVPGRRDP